jgi:hypothetical protein
VCGLRDESTVKFLTDALSKGAYQGGGIVLGCMASAGVCLVNGLKVAVRNWGWVGYNRCFGSSGLLAPGRI